MQIIKFLLKQSYNTVNYPQAKDLYALGVPTWQLIASHKEVATDIEEDKGGFASFIRYKGIHYTADTLDEFFKQVEELKAIAR